MADWKQIRARIHRARASADPAGQLEKLFEKTRDAMAAYELAQHHEGAARSAEALKWYATAAERFRRADWKKKAEEAVARLTGGGVSPVVSTEEPAPVQSFWEEKSVQSGELFPVETRIEETAVEAETGPKEARETPGTVETGVVPLKKRRRRGRRGGRNRHRGRSVRAAPIETLAHPPASTMQLESPRTPPTPQTEDSRSTPAPFSPATGGRIPTEAFEPSEPGPRGRSGDPALSSRLAALEMQLRRLLACTPVRPDQPERAPAGPGVFLLSDSDQTTYYYVEACQTLRIGIGNVLRSGAARRGAESLKPRFADELGIPETRVAKYVSDHCVVRWLQLDDGAPTFAHFAIAVLRPVLND